jgi:hypothetical protein
MVNIEMEIQITQNALTRKYPVVNMSILEANLCNLAFNRLLPFAFYLANSMFYLTPQEGLLRVSRFEFINLLTL